MTRSFRYLLAASVALLGAASNALAQYVPVQPAPAQPPPAQAAPVQPAPAQAVPVMAVPAQPAAPLQAPPPAASTFQVSAFTGYMVNGDVSLYSGQLRVDDAQSFGVSLWRQVRAGTKVELLWIYSQADAQVDSYSFDFPSTKKFSVMTNWFQIGGTHSIRRGKLEPFAGATLGAVWYSPDRIESASGLTTYDASDTWRFGVTLGGGLNVFLTEALAIRGYARMLVPMYFNGGSIYVGTGGSGIAANAGVPAISGDFGVGLVFAR